jgi:hypothetical protein
MISEEDQFEDWVQAKITMAEDYINSAYSYLTYYNGEGEADESDWDDEFEDDDSDGEWDYEYDEDEESFDDDGMDVGVSDYDEALDPDVDDDEIFENKKR